MKEYVITFKIKSDDSPEEISDWVSGAIDENLERGETIYDFKVTPIP